MAMHTYEVCGIEYESGAPVRRRFEAAGPEDAANRAAREGIEARSVNAWTGAEGDSAAPRRFGAAGPARPSGRFRSIRCGCGQVVAVPLATWRVLVAWLLVLLTFPLGLLVLLVPIAEVRCPGCGGRVSAGLLR